MTAETRTAIEATTVKGDGQAADTITTLKGEIERLRGELYVISELDGPNKAETVRQIHSRASQALSQGTDR